MHAHTLAFKVVIAMAACHTPWFRTFARHGVEAPWIGSLAYFAGSGSADWEKIGLQAQCQDWYLRVDHSSWPWLLAMGLGNVSAVELDHGPWPWPLAMAFGNGFWPRVLAMALGDDSRPCLLAMAFGN